MSRSKSIQATPSALLKIGVTLLVLIGSFAAATALAKFDSAILFETFSKFSPGWLVLALGLTLAQVGAQLLRFWVSFHPAERPPTLELLKTTAQGQLFNSVTPLRSGDAFKLVRLTSLPTPVAIVIAALLVERLADNTALVTVAAWSSFPELKQFVRDKVLGVSPFWMLLAVPLPTSVWFILRPAQRGSIRRFIGRVLDHLKSPRFAICLGVSYVAWLLDATALLTICQAGGAGIGLAQALTCIFILNLGLAVPLTVANLGVFEASLAFALTAQGLPALLALGVATLDHALKLLGLLLWASLTSLIRAVASSAFTPSSGASIPKSKGAGTDHRGGRTPRPRA